MSSSSYLLSVPKLKGRENYDDWAFAVKNFMVLEGVDLDNISPDLSDSEQVKAKAKLVMTIDPSLYAHIKTETTVNALWNKLRQLFDDTGFTRKISLLRTLISIRLENSESMIRVSSGRNGTAFEGNRV